jgi:mono/diheme cytochrome c family protein
MKEVRDRSIAFHSQSTHPPPLKEPNLVVLGFSHYHAMCRLCHGAPGYAQTEIAQGLNPRPPRLASEDVQSLKSGELYWVIKNGIKMTGMPAFGPTHDEEELWAMVDFVRRLAELTPQEYTVLSKRAGHHKEKEYGSNQGPKKD